MIDIIDGSLFQRMVVHAAAAISAHPVQFDREAIAELYRRAM